MERAHEKDERTAEERSQEARVEKSRHGRRDGIRRARRVSESCDVGGLVVDLGLLTAGTPRTEEPAEVERRIC